MLAAQYVDFSNDVNDIKVASLSKPIIVHPGCALVRIYSSAINPADAKIFSSFGRSPFVIKFPFTPGYDLSGVIEGLSQDVVGYSVGDEVLSSHFGFTTHGDEFGSAAGGFAEYLVLPVGYLAKKPRVVSHDTAAAIASVGVTAFVHVRMAKIDSTSKVLILGGSAAVGSIAIQLAKLKGAFVVTTASGRAISYVSQFGADAIINYNEQNWWDCDTTGHSGFDVVMDFAGEAGVFAHAQTEGLIKPGGVFLTAASFEAGANLTAHQPRFTTAGFLSAATPDISVILAELMALVETDKLKVVIEEIYPFTQQGVVDIFTKVMGGKALGKHVLKIVRRLRYQSGSLERKSCAFLTKGFMLKFVILNKQC